ncbi:hypothetical protein [Bacillus sp. PS06]|uniref:hypothetical protein n=1 Tax=Bacillus sp. PS06 TaxID=2764176 RepID=UPI00177F13D1|nr:hypothetical protein [Bacillus sp. PS06]MBD8070198.1 hypothetical protein [Bacillus sp. PS06]
MNNDRDKTLEVVLWSIAFPGFGQLLNKQVIKGLAFIFFEVVINVFSKFNTAILLSFIGDIQGAIEITNYQWLMFYPCLYMYAIWDAYKYSKKREETKPYIFLPLAFAAYFVTIGLMYSFKLKLFGILLGPVWLPILFVIPGITIGYLIRTIILRVKAI